MTDTEIINRLTIENERLKEQIKRFEAYDVLHKVPSEVSLILEVVAEVYYINAARLYSASREVVILEPKQISMYLLRKYLRFTLRQIADIFGYTDHSTIINSLKRINNICDTDTITRIRLEKCENIIQYKLGLRTI